MLNSDGLVLYVGRTNNLKTRMTSHFSKTEMTKWKDDVDRIEYVELDGYGDSVIYEAYYIHKFKAKYNKLGAEKGLGTKIELKDLDWVEWRDFSSINKYDLSSGLNIPDDRIVEFSDIDASFYENDNVSDGLNPEPYDGCVMRGRWMYLYESELYIGLLNQSDSNNDDCIKLKYDSLEYKNYTSGGFNRTIYLASTEGNDVVILIEKSLRLSNIFNSTFRITTKDHPCYSELIKAEDVKSWVVK